MTMGEFSENLQRLIDSTPKKVTGRVEVNQVYAHYQHEHPEFHHPDGGEAFYLKTPLYAKSDKYLRNLAAGAIQRDGQSGLKDAMVENMEDLSREVYERAPWEFGDLRASGHPIVEEDGEVVYDRKPMVGRLDADELAIKSHLRYLFDPHRYDYDRRR